MPTKTPDLIITSKTQSADTLQKLLKDDGFTGVTTEVVSDQAEPAEGETTRNAESTATGNEATPASDDAAEITEAKPADAAEPETKKPESEAKPDAKTGEKPKADTKTSSASPSDAGDPDAAAAAVADAGDEGDETEAHAGDGADSETAASGTGDGAAQEPAKAKSSRNARYKRTIAKKDAELAKHLAEIEDLKRQVAAKPAAGIIPPTVEASKPAETKPADATTTAKSESQSQPKPKPKMEDFLDQEDPQAALTEAMADWKYDERERQKAEKERQDREAAESERKSKADADARTIAERDRQLELDRWNASITVAKSNHDDFDDVIAGAQEQIQRNIDQQKSQALIAEVTGSEMAGEVWYYLAGHPEELARIAKATRYEDGMTALDQRRRWHLAFTEVKKIEAKLTASDDDAGADPATKIEPPNPASSMAAAPTNGTEKTAPPATPAVVPEKPKQPPKPTPVTPVGTHGGSRKVDLNDPKQVAAMEWDEYRQVRGMP
jgi:colicin import membrane protein